MADMTQLAKEFAELLDAGVELTAEERVVAKKVFDRVGRARTGVRFDAMYPKAGPLRRELYPRHMEFYRAGRRYRERCMFGGNRVGKTLGLLYEDVCHLTGRYEDWWEGREFHEPVDAWVAGKNAETTKEILQDGLFGDVRRTAKGRNELSYTGLVPRDFIVPGTETYKAGLSGVLQQIRFIYRDSKSEYSTLGFKAYEQGRGSFEGATKHLIHFDEEPSIEVYNEALIRTGTVDGIVIVGFTPLEGMTDTVLQFMEPQFRPPEDLDVEGWEAVR